MIVSLVASQITEQFTSTERPGQGDRRIGPHRSGHDGSGGHLHRLESSVWAIMPIAIAIGVAIGLGDGNIEFTFYLVALIGIGLLATAGMVVSEDSFGPVSDNAAGIAEMSGEFSGEAERIMVSLDAVGNTTKAITKGVAIGSAVIAAVALFASLHRDHRRRSSACSHRREPVPQRDPDQRGQPDHVHRPADRRFGGLPVLGLAIRAVGRSAGAVVHEVRQQFREHPGIMDYTEKPEYGNVITMHRGPPSASWRRLHS